MPLTRLELTRFTAFEHLDLALSPGVNVFIGTNGTGKTHLLKVMYAACDVTRTQESFSEKTLRVFQPFSGRLGRLVHRQQGSSRCEIEVQRSSRRLKLSFSNHTIKSTGAKITGEAAWRKERVECVYIPVKEMLAHAPGFRSLYAARDIAFEEVYADVVDRAYLPVLRGPVDSDRRRLLDMLQESIHGRVRVESETFFHVSDDGRLEFSLLAEGMRKLGLLWLLIQNGSLTRGSVLFWDEPEANLNPGMMGIVVQILLELRRLGVQVFLATHDYVTLKQFDLQTRPGDQVTYHALYRGEDSGEVEVSSTDDYLQIHPNAIADTFAGLYHADVQRALGGERQ
jgi:energy-coupling factor transporter ATP-binding protein EcfA2